MNEERRKSFNNIPDLYDSSRPSYPEALIDKIAVVIPDQARVLEIGVGTGIATSLMAVHGYNILGIEPGDNLVAYVSKKLSDYPNVRLANTKFEDWQMQEGTFDLVMSASAFHWVDPEIGYRKAAEALKDGGHIALFWNMTEPLSDTVYNEIQTVYDNIVPEMSRKPTDKSLEERVRERELAIANSGCFQEITVSQYPWSHRYDTKSYINLLDTYSNHNILPVEVKTEFYNGISEALNRNGGGITRKYISTLYMATKR